MNKLLKYKLLGKAREKMVYKAQCKLWLSAVDKIPSFHCKPGCRQCCTEAHKYGLTVTYDMRANRTWYVSALETCARKKGKLCTALGEHGCNSYKTRPLICMLFGSSVLFPCPLGYGPKKKLSRVKTIRLYNELAFSVPKGWLGTSNGNNAQVRRAYAE